MVRHLVKGEKKYQTIETNGKFLALCEHINSWTSGKEKMQKLVEYNVDQKKACGANVLNTTP